MGSTVETKVGFQSTGVRAFLLISFGLAWGGIGLAHWVLGLSLADPKSQLLMALPVAFGPAIAAFIVRRWVTREGFGDAGLRLSLRAWRYYLIAWLGPAAVFAATLGLATAFGLYQDGLAPLSDLISGVPTGLALLIVLVVPFVVTLAFFGEEFGWRSYLQQRISKQPVRAAFATGFIWAAWHFPLVFTDYSDYSNPIVGMGTWIVLVVPQAIILAWLFLRSGSIWVASLAHAGNNMIIGNLNSVFLVETAGLSSSTVAMLEFVPLAAICGWILLTKQLHTHTRETLNRTASL